MEQARIEHAPNRSLLTYITIADAMVNNWAMTRDFQQSGILTSVDSDEPV